MRLWHFVSLCNIYTQSQARCSRGGVLSASVMVSIQPHEELLGLCSDASVFLLKIRVVNACNHVVYISRPSAHRRPAIACISPQSH